MRQLMERSTLEELKSLRMEYEKIKWVKEKDVTSAIRSVEDYINYVRNNVLLNFEEEYNKLFVLISSREFNNFFSQDAADSLVLSLRKLLPIYRDVVLQMVDPKCEALNNNFIKNLRRILDNIILLTEGFAPSGMLAFNATKIFDISKSNFNDKHIFLSLKSELKHFESQERWRKAKPKLSDSKSVLNKYLNKLFFIFIVISTVAYVIWSKDFIQPINYVLKFIGWIILLLWIPFWFPRTTRNRYKPVVYLIICSVLSIILAYGPYIGIILIILLLGYPLKEILSLNSEYVDRKSSHAKKMLYLPMAISLILVFLITLEPLWFMGLLIWIIWIYVTKINYIYFRPAFDNISKQDKEKDELIEDPWMFTALFISCIIIVMSGLNSTSDQFLSDLYFTSAQIALVLVGFLFAVQGVLSSISLKSNNQKGKNFEMKMILKSMDGLKGFMLAFISLFIISMLGAFSIKSGNSGELQLTIDWLMNPMNFGFENLPAFLKNIVFFSFIVILSLSIAYLHYFFHLGELIVFPFKLSLISEPALIENISTSDKSLKEIIKNEIIKEDKLNGKLFRNIIITNLDEGLFANCELEEAFPNKVNMMSLAKILGNLLIEKQKFFKATIWVRSNQGSIGLRKVFQVSLDKERMDFLNKDDGLDMEYKFIQIGAFFWSPAYEESQIM